MFEKINVLYVDLEKIVKDDIIWGLVELGINVERSKYIPPVNGLDLEKVEKLMQEMEMYNLVISQNFSATIAEACHRRKIPYISWIYDSPQTATYRNEAFYPESFIFSFDKNSVNRLKLKGVLNVYHQPLAANIAYTSGLAITDEDVKKYQTDVSFIGKMYKTTYYKELYAGLPETMRNHFDNIIANNLCKWGENSIYKQLDKNEIDAIYQILNKQELDVNKIDIDYLIETLMFAVEVAGRERIELLNEAAKIGKTSLYTYDPEEYRNILKCELNPATKGNDELYKIYYSSRINLNISLHSIESGIPQRVFDIMSVGGFVLSNYQPELEELFDIDKEIVVYRNKDEFIDKLRYYLNHEDERIRVGINGYLKVKDKYTYPKCLEKMLEIVLKEYK